MKIEAGEWVVVCDGRKALILENKGDAKFPNLRRKETHEHKEARTSELGTDRPGRVQQSVGTAHAAVAQTDFHDLAERAFLETVARRLHDAASRAEANGFIIIAPPRALGALRGMYTPAVAAAVRHELHKDLVHVPIDQIERQLSVSQV